jgi:NAD(P)-dependent dehydrogenase (short-subunit alcohol dehydrogenase family)
MDTMKDLAEQHPDTFLGRALDVADRSAVFATIKTAHDHFGELDIVVNNAGYGQFGMVEELSEPEARDQIETNLFGALWVTQAALPYLREARRGHFLQVSSIGGISAFPGVGIYHASKWALEGLSQSLSLEVKPFGLYVTLIEPASFSTDWSGASAKRRRRSMPISRCARRRRSGSRPIRRETRSPRPLPYSRLSTPRCRRCGCSSAPCHSVSSSTSAPAASRPGVSGSRWPSSPRAAEATQL